MLQASMTHKKHPMVACLGLSWVLPPASNTLDWRSYSGLCYIHIYIIRLRILSNCYRVFRVQGLRVEILGLRVTSATICAA